MPHKDPEARKAFMREYGARYYQENKKKIGKTNAEWKKQNPERAKEILLKSRSRPEAKALRRAYRLRPERRIKTRAAVLKRKYNMTLEQYDSMLAGQNGLCAICHQPETFLHKRSPDPAKHFVPPLCVDHDHKTGQIRGLLCTACNVAIGRLEEDPERMRNAIAYLAKT